MENGPQVMIKQQLEVAAVHDNTTQELIQITTDKLHLILSEHLQSVSAQRSWHTPLSLLATIVLVFCTATFKKAFGVSADTWAAIFIISAALSAFWLYREIVTRPPATSMNDLLDLIKNKSDSP